MIDGSFFRDVRWLRVKNIGSIDIPPCSVVICGDPSDGVLLRQYPGTNRLYLDVKQMANFDAMLPEGVDETFLITGPNTIPVGCYGVASIDLPLPVSVDPVEIAALVAKYGLIDGLAFGPSPQSFLASAYSSYPLWQPLGLDFDANGQTPGRIWVVPKQSPAAMGESFGPLTYGPSSASGGHSLFPGLVGTQVGSPGAPTTGTGFVCRVGGAYLVSAFASVGTTDQGITITLTVTKNGILVVSTTRQTPTFDSGGYGSIKMTGMPRENMAISFPIRMNTNDLIDVTIGGSSTTSLYATDGYVSFLPQ